MNATASHVLIILATLDTFYGTLKKNINLLGVMIATENRLVCFSFHGPVFSVFGKQAENHEVDL